MKTTPFFILLACLRCGCNKARDAKITQLQLQVELLQSQIVILDTQEKFDATNNIPQIVALADVNRMEADHKIEDEISDMQNDISDVTNHLYYDEKDIQNNEE